MTNGKAICVVGASGLVGSNIVRVGLERGYVVHGTMRDRSAPQKAPFLSALPGALDGLRLFSADMANEGDFDTPLIWIIRHRHRYELDAVQFNR